MVTLRPSEPGDLEALYHIALATGLAGGDASHIHKDPKLIGHIYAGPYAILAPDLALVAVDDEGVAGYIVGADDTPSWDERLEREWWPALRARLQEPDYEDRARWSAAERRTWMIFHPWRTPSEVHQNHRAHLHMNILPRLQRRGIGTKLLDACGGGPYVVAGASLPPRPRIDNEPHSGTGRIGAHRPIGRTTGEVCAPIVDQAAARAFDQATSALRSSRSYQLCGNAGPVPPA
jgi:GNAT superfamily N-acetyltransferase